MLYFPSNGLFSRTDCNGCEGAADLPRDRQRPVSHGKENRRHDIAVFGHVSIIANKSVLRFFTKQR